MRGSIPPQKPFTASDARASVTLLDLLRQAQLAQNAFLQELSPAEYAAIGTPEYWSAKDHIAHMTFWRQRLVLKLEAVLHQQTPPPSEAFELLNNQVFEQQRERSWPDVLSESEQTYAQLFTSTEQLTEEDLTSFNHFDWMPRGEPLYTTFIGNCYEHAQQHLAQYYFDRHDLPRAIHTYETWTSRVLDAEVPETLQGYVLYNLACFYATHNLLEKAAPTLLQALTLYPGLKPLSLTDPDLAALRDQVS